MEGVYRSSYRHITDDEVNSPEERKKRELYDHRSLRKITQLLNMNCMKMMMEMELPTYIVVEVVLPKGNDMVSETQTGLT